MAALNLLNSLNKRNGSTLVCSSLSPQLSGLKQDGTLQLRRGLFHLLGKSPYRNEKPGLTLLAESGPGSFNAVPKAREVKAASGGSAW